ncbi:MAG TPA: LLM class flavin-dependent oxidoreductase [Bacillota bacterium]
MSQRQMALVAFMQAANVTVYAGSWRYPSAELDFLTLPYYQKIAQILEQGKFDMVFFDDRLAMPGVYGDSVADSVRHGARVVKLDLLPVLGAMAASTRHIGLGATYSTTYYHPFHVARVFASLDHLSGGRAAWNVVTSANDAEAQNFGYDDHLEHDTRYDRADEFVAVVHGLWDTWDDDALLLNREQGLFADPDKVERLNHQGQWFRSRGPLTVPRPPQGYPLILQAGQSQRGRQFAARWADCVFTHAFSLAASKAHYAEQKELVARYGRNPDEFKILPMVYVIVGETEAIAREKEALLLQLVDPVASLVLLAELANYDFARHGLDDLITDDLIQSMSGIRGVVEALAKHLGRENVTVRRLAEHRATINQAPRFVGTAQQVADQMEVWFREQACDGFVIAATHLPGTFEEFVRLVVPELQRRGLFRTAYSGRTLRENLGIRRPSRGEWRNRVAR